MPPARRERTIVSMVPSTPRKLLVAVVMVVLLVVTLPSGAPRASILPIPRHGSPPVLHWGSKGLAVRRLQACLIALRYLPRGSVNGMFGDRTWHAVVAFQGWEGLQRDGIVGPKTNAALPRARGLRIRGVACDVRSRSTSGGRLCWWSPAAPPSVPSTSARAVPATPRPPAASLFTAASGSPSRFPTRFGCPTRSTSMAARRFTGSRTSPPNLPRTAASGCRWSTPRSCGTSRIPELRSGFAERRAPSA
jgi:Putative peptidoglycan binding domain